MRGIDCRRMALRLVVWLLPFLALAGCAGCSRKANVPVTASTPGLGGPCGQKDDGLIHIPPGYNSFIPPATGHSYADPQYGCGITRLTTFGEFQGNVVVPIAKMPAMNSSDAPWDPTNPVAFYFTQGNRFFKGTISGSTVGGTALHTFAGYTSVVAPDQEDLSDDGCKYWLVGTPSDGGLPVGILYDLCTDTVVSQSLVVGVKDSATGWD